MGVLAAQHTTACLKSSNKILMIIMCFRQSDQFFFNINQSFLYSGGGCFQNVNVIMFASPVGLFYKDLARFSRAREKKKRGMCTRSG
jgi:hypothetical protein